MTEASTQVTHAILEAIKLEVAAQIGAADRSPVVAPLPQPTETALLSKKDAARFLNVSVRTIANWMTRGYLPFYRIGKIVRFRQKDILDYLNENHRLTALRHR
jgi:excisionase family DNA binding protein